MRQGDAQKRHFYAEDAQRALEKAQMLNQKDRGIQRSLAALYNYQGELADDWQSRARFYAKADALLAIVSRNDPEAFLLRSQCLMERADIETDPVRRKIWLDQAEAALKADVILTPLLEKARLAALRGDSYGFVLIFLREAAQSNNSPEEILALIKSAVFQDKTAQHILGAPLPEAFILLEQAAMSNDWGARTAALIKAGDALGKAGDDGRWLSAFLRMRLAVLQQAPNTFVKVLEEAATKRGRQEQVLAPALSMRNYLTRNDEEMKVWKSPAMHAFLAERK